MDFRKRIKQVVAGVGIAVLVSLVMGAFVSRVVYGILRALNGGG
ncbi:MAG: hypothetical protein A4E65_01157 [Syntrophorhabdus sp. PtaU1.Bin153]|nr:MAG: hypothetical protein A4E65_01157 [Syntrophorhabdus sp. PtaU1.Bin153]